MVNIMDNDIYEKLKSDYYEHDDDRFRSDAIEAVGLTGHPKADKVYAYAYQQGHSAGFSEVFNILQDVAEIVK